jgi:hypothetical protein
MMIKLIRGSKIIQRSDEDWKRNKKNWELRGFKLYSEEKESKPKKKKKEKDDV